MTPVFPPSPKADFNFTPFSVAGGQTLAVTIPSMNVKITFTPRGDPSVDPALVALSDGRLAIKQFFVQLVPQAQQPPSQQPCPIGFQPNQDPTGQSDECVPINVPPAAATTLQSPPAAKTLQKPPAPLGGGEEDEKPKKRKSSDNKGEEDEKPKSSKKKGGKRGGGGGGGGSVAA